MSTDADVADQPRGVFATLRRADAHLPDARIGLPITVFCAAIGAAARLVLPLLMKAVIDKGITDKSVDLGAVGRRCALALTALLLGQIATRTAEYRLGAWSERMLASLRRQCVDRFLDMSLDQHARSKRGVLVARATTDVESISRFFEWGAISWVINSIVLLVLSGFLIAIDVRLGLIALSFAVPVVVVLRRMQRRIRTAYDAVREHVAGYLGRTGEIVTGAAVVRAYGLEDVMRTSTSTFIDRRRRASVRAGTLGALLFPIGDVFAALSVSAVVLTAVHIGVGGGLTKGSVVAVIFATMRLLDPVGDISENIDQTQLAVAGLGRVLDVLDLPADVTEPVHPVDLPRGRLGVALDRVSYAYPPRAVDDVAPLALHDVSFEVPPGQSLAIVGTTGSGKSTTARLLSRMCDPGAGVVTVGGVSLRDIADESLRRRVQLVPQEPFLFDDSIAANVSFIAPEATGVVEAAVARLGLDEWVRSLPEGLATRVGERGADISAGERQLVALLRAEVIGPDVLILDEATSSVDAATESRINDALDRIAGDRTLIVIAHRLSTAARMDRIVVLEQGQLVESGTHESLSTAGGRYGELLSAWASNTE